MQRLRRGFAPTAAPLRCAGLRPPTGHPRASPPTCVGPRAYGVASPPLRGPPALRGTFRPPFGAPLRPSRSKGGGKAPPLSASRPLTPPSRGPCRAPRFAKAHCVRAKASAKADPQTRVPGRGLAQRLAAPLKGTPCFIYSAALLRGLRPPWRVPPKLARGRANTEQPRGDGTPLKVITPDGVNTQHPGRQLGRWLPRLGRRVLGRTEPKNQHPNNSLVPKLSYIKS